MCFSFLLSTKPLVSGFQIHWTRSSGLVTSSACHSSFWFLVHFCRWSMCAWENVYVYPIQPAVFTSPVVSSFGLLALSMTEFWLWQWSCGFVLYFYQPLLYIFSSYFMKYTQDWSLLFFSDSWSLKASANYVL